MLLFTFFGFKFVQNFGISLQFDSKLLVRLVWTLVDIRFTMKLVELPDASNHTRIL